MRNGLVSNGPFEESNHIDFSMVEKIINFNGSHSQMLHKRMMGERWGPIYQLPASSSSLSLFLQYGIKRKGRNRSIDRARVSWSALPIRYEFLWWCPSHKASEARSKDGRVVLRRGTRFREVFLQCCTKVVPCLPAVTQSLWNIGSTWIVLWSKNVQVD